MWTRRISITRLSQFVIAYMILAFVWWSYHLWQQNELLYKAEKNLLEIKFSVKNDGINLSELEKTTEYQTIVHNWQKGKRMVVAEGLFFTACLIFGLWVINRSANREVMLARQRRNFLLSITHELKSPIASLRLIIETMLRRSLTDEQRNPLLSNGLKDASRLQQLVEDLLLAARLEDSWQPLHEPVDLLEIARETAESLRIRFPEANIEILPKTGHAPKLADKIGIVAVIKNLLENAVKYSPMGAPIQFSVAIQNDKCTVRVSDRGQGIPDAEKKRIFEKFYRIGNEETRKTTGTGLGLFIVNQVVKAHNGTITVANNNPTGTVFTFEI